jgi:hypothetical protein
VYYTVVDVVELYCFNINALLAWMSYVLEMCGVLGVIQFYNWISFIFGTKCSYSGRSRFLVVTQEGNA